MLPAPRRTAAGAFPIDAFTDRTASVTLVIPALDEAGSIARTVKAGVRLRDRGVLDEVLVADSGSQDGTPERAADAGAKVVAAAEVYPESGPLLGKGDTMWRALSLVETEVVAFLDADLDGDLDAVITGLIGPLGAPGAARAFGLAEAPGGFGQGRVEFVKGAFHRIAPDGAPPDDPFDGGRVTEMMARPLINLWRPDLAGFHQPLGGQVAGYRDLLRSIPFLTGYAVEIGMLLDVVDRVGLDAVVEADLGTLRNRPRTSAALAPMAQEVLYGFTRRVLPSVARPRWRPYWRPGEVAYPDAEVVERPPIDPFAR